MSDQKTKNFSQKGFSRNFLELMKSVEKNKLCCLDFLIGVNVKNSSTFIFSGDGTENNPLVGTVIGGGGSGGVADSFQFITTGGTVTINNGVNVVVINPAVPIASLNIIQPAIPSINNNIEYYFGGTITSGPVVISLSIIANTGQSIIDASPPINGSAGAGVIAYKMIPSINIWFAK